MGMGFGISSPDRDGFPFSSPDEDRFLFRVRMGVLGGNGVRIADRYDILLLFLFCFCF